MSIRIALLCLSLSGILYGQDPHGPPPQETPQTPAAGQAAPDQAKPAPPQPSQPKPSQPRPSPPKGTTSKPAKAVVKNVKPAAAASAIVVSPAQKLLDALSAAIQQAADRKQRPDIEALRAQEAQLQDNLRTNGDEAQISKQAAMLLDTIYAPVTVPAPQPPPRKMLEGSRNYWLAAILISLISPLICVAGFWWGAKVVERKVRDGMQEAGLL